MEWVETTGRTVAEAKDAALDQLGVDEQDAEFEVLAEAKSGLFGRLRSEARVRARVRPTRPRPKEDRQAQRSRARNARRRAERTAGEGGEGASQPAEANRPDEPAGGTHGTRGDQDVQEDVSLEDQAAVARAFLEGLLERFGAPDSTLAVTPVDEDTIEVAVAGPDLGLLIGPKGATLTSLQELARTVVQRRTGARSGRLLVDVAGYRHKRKAALEAFTHEVVEQVLATGTQRMLEAMPPADRKVVHDVVNDIDGVSTISEGDEPRRRVVIRPEPR